jgi:hypothetical protein
MKVELGRVRAIHVFVDDWVAAGHFWSRMLGRGTVRRLPLGAVVEIGDLDLLFCPPDPRNPIGGSPVAYFFVERFNEMRTKVREWGCVELHLPLKIGKGEQITQFRCPFGTIFGIQGPVGDEAFWPDARAEAEALRSHLERDDS